SAVLVLDTTAAAYADRIGRYVRAGGGLVLWSPAVDARRLAALAPGRERGAVIEDEGRPPGDSVPREALSIAPITGLVPEAVVLERRGEHVTLAARRLGAGRVVETGYVNTWRWRLAGGEEEAPERHRTWLAGLVASVAYAGREELAVPPTNAAPLATLIDRLGPAVAEAYADAGGGMDPAVLARWLFAALCLALLVEWASRRTRGARCAPPRCSAPRGSSHVRLRARQPACSSPTITPARPPPPRHPPSPPGARRCRRASRAGGPQPWRRALLPRRGCARSRRARSRAAGARGLRLPGAAPARRGAWRRRRGRCLLRRGTAGAWRRPPSPAWAHPSP